MKEPTYSQIQAACRAAWPESYSKDYGVTITTLDWEAMKAALMAAQKVDRNIYGDCHVGAGVDSIHFMTTDEEARDKILSWNHEATYNAAVADDLRKRLPQMFNAGLDAAIQVIKNGVNAAAWQSGLMGIQDDDQIIIAAIERMKK